MNRKESTFFEDYDTDATILFSQLSSLSPFLSLFFYFFFNSVLFFSFFLYNSLAVDRTWKETARLLNFLSRLSFTI